MRNLNLIESQPRWRVRIVHYFASLMGVIIHVEGIPFGSSRNRRREAKDEMAAGAVSAAKG